MLSDFKNAPMEDAIFIDSNGLCKRTNVYPDSIFYIIQDSLITVPNSMGDQITQQLQLIPQPMNRRAREANEVRH